MIYKASAPWWKASFELFAAEQCGQSDGRWLPIGSKPGDKFEGWYHLATCEGSRYLGRGPNGHYLVILEVKGFSGGSCYIATVNNAPITSAGEVVLFSTIGEALSAAEHEAWRRECR